MNYIALIQNGMLEIFLVIFISFDNSHKALKTKMFKIGE